MRKVILDLNVIDPKSFDYSNPDADPKKELHKYIAEQLGSALLLGGCPDLFVNGFKEKRNKHKMLRLLLLELGEHIFKSARYIYSAPLRKMTDEKNG